MSLHVQCLFLVHQHEKEIYHHEHCMVKLLKPVPMNPKMSLVSPSSFWPSLQLVTECQLWKVVSFHSFQMISPLLLVSLYLFN